MPGRDNKQLVQTDGILAGSDRNADAIYHDSERWYVESDLHLAGPSPWADVRMYRAMGDGAADDTNAFRSAIAVVSAAGGGEVFVPKGTYRITSTLTVPAGVTLRGVGNRKAILQQPAGTNTDLIQITGDDSAVETLGLDGQQSAYVVGASLIRVAANRVSVRFCRLDNAKESGVMVQNSTEVEVLYNRVSSAAWHGIEVGNPPDVGGGTGVQDFHVIGNRIYDCGILANTSTGKGISILSGSSSQPLSRGTVNNNLIRGCTNIGIELFANLSPGGSVEYVTVNNNVVERATPPGAQMGISLGFCNHCTADGNVVKDCQNGIENAGGNGNSVCGNTIHNPTQTAISVSGGTTNSSHVGNVITGSFQYGIHDNSSPTHNSGNIYNSNRITGAGGSVVSRQIGIFLNNGFANEQFTIIGNQVSACSGSGIYLFTADTGFVTQNLCKGNVTNAANSATDADIYFNLSAGQLDKIVVGPNIYGSFSPNQTATDAQASQTMVVGGFKKLASQTVNIAQVTLAHGLGYTPSKVLIKPKSNATFYESAAADGTNVYLRCSADAQTADVYVA